MTSTGSWLTGHQIAAAIYWLLLLFLPIAGTTVDQTPIGGSVENLYWSVSRITSNLDFWFIFSPQKVIVVCLIASFFVYKKYDIISEKISSHIESVWTIFMYWSLAMGVLVIALVIFLEGLVMSMSNAAYTGAVDMGAFVEFVGTEQGRNMVDKFAEENSDIWVSSVCAMIVSGLAVFGTYTEVKASQ